MPVLRMTTRNKAVRNENSYNVYLAHAARKILPPYGLTQSLLIIVLNDTTVQWADVKWPASLQA